MKNKSLATFSPLVLAVFAAVAVGTLVLGTYLASQQKSAFDTHGASTHSHSAIGHAGLAHLLEKLNIPVIKSRSGSLAKSHDGVLVLAEPATRFGGDNPLPTLMEAGTILLVLPKWNATPHPTRSTWAESVSLKSNFEATMTLNNAVKKGEVVRVEKVDKWTTNAFNIEPKFTSPVQLIKSDLITPLIASDKGILLGVAERDENTVWVLSDPDVLSNHGFGADGKRNAVLAVEIIKHLREGNSGSVVFDETIHGFVAKTESPLRTLFEFPFSLITLQVAAAIALLLWATMGRFGAPQKPPPPLTAGKQGLLDNIARLTEFAGHQKLIARRYVEATIRDTARQIHAPKGLSDEELAKWVQRTGIARGVKEDNIAILDRANQLLMQGRSDLQEFVELSRSIHRWKQEILNGRSKHTDAS